MKIENAYQRYNVQTTGQMKQTRAEGANAPQRTAAQPSQAQTPPARGDRVELSAQAQEMKQAQAAAQAAPDVRTDKVEPLKQQIASGTYQVDATKVANAMLSDLLKDMG